MRVLIMPNLGKSNAARAVWAVAGRLAELGMEIAIDRRYEDTIQLPNARYIAPENVGGECSVILAIGGDGTLLHAARYAVAANKPLLGVNVGRLGFMAGLEMGELELLEKLVNGNYRTEKRMLLDCAHYHGGQVGHSLALNDVVVSNDALSRMVELNVFCSGRLLTSYRADGVIFSTPTGSTAYTLSAGGPIIDPQVDCICMTPICPHSLFSRPVLFSAQTTLCVRPERHSNPAFVTVDGREGERLFPDDAVEIRQSEQALRLIILKERSFYETLSYKFKLHNGQRR